MAVADAARRRVVPRQLKEAARHSARRMEEADGARRRAVPRQLLEAAPSIARHTAEASAAGETTASRWSLRLHAARSAHSVCGTHSLSPTVCRRHHPQHPTDIQNLEGFRDVLRYVDENPSGLELTVEVTA